MEVTVTQNGDTCTINVPGQLDVMTSTPFKQTLTDAVSSSAKIELDFSNTALVSSAGLRVLLQAEKTVLKSGKSMTFKNVSPEVMEVFDITGVDKIFTILVD